MSSPSPSPHGRTDSSGTIEPPQYPHRTSLPGSTLAPTTSTLSNSSQATVAFEDGARPKLRSGSAPSSHIRGRQQRDASSPSPIPNKDDVLPEGEPYAATPYTLQEWDMEAQNRQRTINERFLRRLKEENDRREEKKKYEHIYERLLKESRNERPSRWSSLVNCFSSKDSSGPSPSPVNAEAATEGEKPAATQSQNADYVALAKHYYPPRFKAKALVFDFGDGSMGKYFDATEHDVATVEHCWREKPDWSLVRWIHVPFGRGVAQSSLEDLFLHDHKEKGREKFVHAGEALWPFLQTESLNFRSWKEFKRMRDIYLLLSAKDEIRDELDASTFENNVKGTFLKDDMIWRASHIGTTTDYWDLVQCDIPYKLPEGGGLSEAMISMYHYCMMGPRDGLEKLQRDIDDMSDGEACTDLDDDMIAEEFDRKNSKTYIPKDQQQDRRNSRSMGQPVKVHKKNRQAIVRHPFFKGSQMVRNDFRAFHAEGYLLTMSAASGVDYLDNEFQHYLEISSRNRLANADASCIGRLADRFSRWGCKNWHRKSSAWLLVHIITEIGMAPNPFVMGMVGPTLGEAYQAVVLDLNRRRYHEPKRKETVKLVRDMLACDDELSVLVALYGKRVSLFAGLLRDWKTIEAGYLRDKNFADNADGESSYERIDCALRLAKENHTCFTRLLADVRRSLTALSHLRSIEQDELIQYADKGNRAVVLFAGVTIVFLPLSFVTSYFGMNLVDITDREKSQRYFWETAGSVALVMVATVLIFGYRHHLRWRNAMRWNRELLRRHGRRGAGRASAV